MTLYGRGVAQSGSAPVLGTGGREFESRRPDQFSKLQRFPVLMLTCSGKAEGKVLIAHVGN